MSSATLPEYIQSEQVAHAGSVAKLEHPLLGTIKTPNTPFGMPGTAVGARGVGKTTKAIRCCLSVLALLVR